VLEKMTSTPDGQEIWTDGGYEKKKVRSPNRGGSIMEALPRRRGKVKRTKSD